MSSTLQAFFATVPFAIVIALAAMVIAYAGLGLAAPRFMLYPYLALLFTLSGTSFGRLDAVAPSIYSRGAGLLLFPLLMWLLLAATLWIWFSSLFAKRQLNPCNLLPWFLAWAALLLGHVVVGVLRDIPLKDILSIGGFSNIVWMAGLIIAIQYAFRSPAQVRELAKLVVLVGLARASYGVARWLFLGGDPANAYANRLGLDVKLTFFDINDSLVCWLAISIAALKLLRPSGRAESPIWMLVYLMTIAVCAACIVLSYRRTAWVGVLLAGAYLLLHMPLRRRIQVMVLAAPVMVAGVAYSAWHRLSQTRGARGLGGFLFDVQSRTIGPESQRLLELKLVGAEFLDHPLFGVGAWGRFKGYQSISWHLGPDGGTFVHSGMLHVAFKTGLIGLALLIGLIVALIVFWRRNAANIEPSLQPIAITGIAGLLFMLPDMIIGTPIPQVRTMQMLAFCLALPYLAYGVTLAPQRSPVPGYRYVQPTVPIGARTA